MPLFYFDVADGRPPIACDGVELDSVTQARATALQYLGSMIRDEKPSFWESDDWRMIVSDARHLTLFTLTLLSHDSPAASRPTR